MFPVIQPGAAAGLLCFLLNKTRQGRDRSTSWLY